jgi:hypothetical protein
MSIIEGGAGSPARHDLEQVVARAVRQLGSVRVDRLKSKLPKPYQRPQAELAAALGSLAERREVFRHPTAKTTFLAHDPLAALPARVLGAVGDGARTAAELVQHLAAGAQASTLGPDGLKAAVESVVQSLVEAGQLFEHRFGKGRAAVRYGRDPATHDPGPRLRATALAALEGRSLTAAELRRRLGVEARQLGLGAKAATAAIDGALRALVAEGSLFEHLPPSGGRSLRYARAPQPRPALGPYVSRAVDALRAALTQLAPFGVTAGEVVRALAHELGLDDVDGAGSPGRQGSEASEGAQRKAQSGTAGGEGDAESRVLRALDEVAASEPEGSILPVPAVRNRAGLDKATFDRAALALAEAERVALHYYDRPYTISESERDKLVRDERGTYYIHMARRSET